MRIVLPGCWPVVFSWSGAGHWHRDGTKHGPQSNPTICAFAFVRLGRTTSPTFIGRRLWLYVRGGYAIMFDAYVDRRVR